MNTDNVATEPTSLNAKLGHAIYKPDYTDVPTSSADILPGPLRTDDIYTLTRIHSTLAELVDTGKSTAIYSTTHGKLAAQT